MPRYEHYLAPQGRDSYPERIVALECSGEYSPVAPNSTIEIEKLTQWHMATCHGKLASYGKVKTWQGTDSDSFYTSIADYLRQTGSTHMVCSTAMRCASLLNLWKMIERGHVLLAGTEQNPERQNRLRWQQKTDSFCLTEDPPTIIHLLLPDLPGRLIIVDARNYGIHRSTTDMPDIAWVQNLARLVASACAEMKRRKLGGWKATAGSIAAASWRSKFLKHTVLCHSHGSATTLERQGYYGGRCECFRIGTVNGPIYHLDIKAMYPSLCLSARIPCRLIGKWTTPHKAGKLLDMHKDCCIAEVTIKTDEPDYPLRRGANTIWPTGRFRTVLCGPELEDCAMRQRIVQYHSVASYESDPILRDYMVAWHALRTDAELQGDALLVQLCKAVMCCLPGKFGQRNKQWVEAPSVMADRPWDSWYEMDKEGNPQRYRSLDWRVCREIDTGLAPEAIPAISAWITSAGRQLLTDLIRAAGRSEVYYCDTDSLFCSESAYRRLIRAGHIVDGEWGKLQVKGVHADATFLGIKYYATDGEIVCSGIPQATIASGPVPSSVYVQMGMATALRNGTCPVSARVVRQLERNGDYPLGLVGHNGIVSPFHLAGE